MYVHTVDNFKSKLVSNLQRLQQDNYTYDVLLLGAIGKYCKWLSEKNTNLYPTITLLTIFLIMNNICMHACNRESELFR
jgi:hypothetical protein